MRKNVGQMENSLEKKGKGRYGVSGHMHKGKKPWKKGKFSHKQQLEWLRVKSDKACEIACKDGEVCISGPVEAKPICVRKKDLKKSMKLFQRYQKKEKKAWKKFQKENYNKKDQDQYYSKFDVTDSDSMMTKEYEMKDNKMDKHHMKEMKKHHKKGMKKHHMKGMKKHHMKGMKMHHMEDSMKPHVPAKFSKSGVCTIDDFSQIRARMMGWFHLMHGQDHLAKKEMEMNLKHFHKKVSVQKESRVHNGNQCTCFKSAMWQFKELDKDGNDHLMSDELSMVEENSAEPCIQPYLTSCDLDADGKLSSDEWCCCFANVLAPCLREAAKIQSEEAAGKKATYKPSCDKEGYYHQEQCSEDKCWCVDYNGNVYKETITEGRAHCHKKDLNDYENKS